MLEIMSFQYLLDYGKYLRVFLGNLSMHIYNTLLRCHLPPLDGELLNPFKYAELLLDFFYFLF